MKVELDNHATKADLKNATGVDTLKFSKKVGLASLKTENDKLDVGKLVTTPVDLTKLIDVVKNEVLRKTVYGALVKKVNAIQTTDTSNVVWKADYNTKSYEITQEFNKFATYSFAARLAQGKLATKANIDDFVEKTLNLNKKATLNKTRPVEDEKKLTDLISKVPQILEKGYDFLLRQMYFTGGDGYQNFLDFALMINSIILDSNKKVIDWISTEISSEKIKWSDNNLEPTMSSLANGRVILKSDNSVLVQKLLFIE